ncbi:hypothetical protein DXZ20_15020 [Leptolyngbyaceae cyanobacterium CCMR0081]|uniref:Uncharacterized protein n=2 Tax=Adonisia TaxID=2950183 RepID=A0A6M0RL38_9CYAN|nr:hypothetical protein [Adonisia turfae CCMR0081]
MGRLKSHDLLIFRTSRCGQAYNIKPYLDKAFKRHTRVGRYVPWSVVSVSKEPKEKIVELKLRIPISLRSEFKSMCAARDENMKDVLVASMRKYIEQHKSDKSESVL